MSERLFIYGTLGPGRPNEHVMKNIGGEWQAASVPGRLVCEGWGAAMGYPGIVLDHTAAKVDGYIFTSANLVNHWQELDAFEGDGYERVITEATLDDGTVTDAWVYALKTDA